MKNGQALLTLTAIFALGLPLTAVAQNTHDCREKKGAPLISGHWKDDGTTKEIDIALRNALHNVMAMYSEPHSCPHPGADGKPVPLQTDFEGVVTGSKFKGILWVCKWQEEGGRTYTFTTANADLSLWLSDDGMKLSGYWHNPDTNKDEDITFTRLDKPQFPATSDFERVTAGKGAKIYAKPDQNSELRAAPESGAKLEILAADTDDKGNVTWYEVDDPSRSIGSHYYGWIKLDQVICGKSERKPN